MICYINLTSQPAIVLKVIWGEMQCRVSWYGEKVLPMPARLRKSIFLPLKAFLFLCNYLESMEAHKMNWVEKTSLCFAMHFDWFHYIWNIFIRRMSGHGMPSLLQWSEPSPSRSIILPHNRCRSFPKTEGDSSPLLLRIYFNLGVVFASCRLTNY